MYVKIDTVLSFLAIIVSVLTAYLAYKSTVKIKRKQLIFEDRFTNVAVLEPVKARVVAIVSKINGEINASKMHNEKLPINDLLKLYAESRDLYFGITHRLGKESRDKLSMIIKGIEAKYEESFEGKDHDLPRVEAQALAINFAEEFKGVLNEEIDKNSKILEDL